MRMLWFQFDMDFKLMRDSDAISINVVLDSICCILCSRDSSDMKTGTQRDELLLLNLSCVNLAELSEKSSLMIVHEMCF